VGVVNGQGVSVAYDEAGEGEPVTLLHGFTLNGRSWREVIAKMRDGRRWIMPDIRGHGDTRTDRGAPVTMEACAADLALLWDALGIERTHVVGYSMGGRLALHVAVRLTDRVRSIVTVSAHAGLDETAREGRRQGDEALAERIERFGIEPFVNYWAAQPMFAGLERRGAAFAARLRAERLSNDPQGLAASLRGMGAGAMEPLWDDLQQLDMPCTFVAGADDAPYVNYARRLSESVSGSHLEIVPRCGHSVAMERPAAMAKVLSAHLAWAGAAPAGASSSTLTPA
jgi:2-succinyl-6-hydroxy-2,4-cyclohexadiene-1-carboxylate synthase